MNRFDIFFDELQGVYQVRTKTDVTLIEFSSEIQEAIFLRIAERAKTGHIPTPKELLSLGQWTEVDILDVFQDLRSSGILQDPPLSNIPQPLLGYTIIHFGEEALGARLLERASHYNLYIKDSLPLDKLSYETIENYFIGNNLIIVDALRYNPQVMQWINDLAILHQKPWLLIEGFIPSGFFSIGPLLYPPLTGCYNCFLDRLQSNDPYYKYAEGYRRFLLEEKSSSKADALDSPALLDIAVAIALSDSQRYLFDSWETPETWRSALMLSPRDYSIKRQRLHRNPLCSTCRPQLQHSPAPWLEPITL